MYVKLGNGPKNLCNGVNAAWKNAYSAPDLATTVPNSAKASAPRKIKHYKLQFNSLITLPIL